MMVMKAVQQLLFDVDWRAGGSHELDVLVIDTPPGTGDVALSLGQLVEVDGTLDHRLQRLSAIKADLAVSRTSQAL